MKSAGRSRTVAPWQKPKVHEGPDPVRDQGEAYLLPKDERRDQEPLRDYEDGIIFDHHHDDNAERIVELESQCIALQTRIFHLQRDHRQKMTQRDSRDKTRLNMIRDMDDTIKRLEGESKTLRSELNEKDEKLKAQKKKSDTLTSPVVSNIAEVSKQGKKAGPSWNVVSKMASKLSSTEKENTALKEALIAKREAMQKLIVSSTTLQGELETSNRENQRLTAKCESLLLACSSIATAPTTENNEPFFRNARLEELEETNELMRNELSELKTILRAKMGGPTTRHEDMNTPTDNKSMKNEEPTSETEKTMNGFPRWRETLRLLKHDGFVGREGIWG